MADDETKIRPENALLPPFDTRSPESFEEQLATLRTRLDDFVGEMRLLQDGNTTAVVELVARADALRTEAGELRTSVSERLRDETEALQKDVRRAEAAANRIQGSLDALEADIRASLKGATAQFTVYPTVLVIACAFEAVLFGLYLYFSGALPWLQP